MFNINDIVVTLPDGWYSVQRGIVKKFDGKYIGVWFPEDRRVYWFLPSELSHV